MTAEIGRILVVASAGGHLVQLRRLRAAWRGMKSVWITTDREYRDVILAEARENAEKETVFFSVMDANIDRKLKLIFMMIQVFFITVRYRPSVVLTTGAAPGYFAVRIGKLFGARTIWIDSIANSEGLSLSGQKVLPHCDLVLTQWPHIAGPNGAPPHYLGSTL